MTLVLRDDSLASLRNQPCELPSKSSRSIQGGKVMSILHGVYTGSVIDNHDPQQLARVRVRVSAVAETRRGVWARLATMMAGADRGTLFIPEVGDEVIVAFESGDVRKPCVLGALWNAKARPPANGAVDVKTIRLSNKVTVRMVDNASTNSLMFETPSGQRIVLEENPPLVRIEDANGNSIRLTPSAIEMVAPVAIKLTSSVIELNASSVNVQTAMANVDGVVQCDTLITNAVVASSYTPGAGNIW